MASENRILGFKPEGVEPKLVAEPGGYIEFPKFLYLNGKRGPYVIVQDAEEEKQQNAKGFWLVGTAPPAEPPQEEPKAEAEPKKRGRKRAE